MSLFTVNRHLDTEENEPKVDDAVLLDKVLERIEKNKKRKEQKKERKKEKIKQHKELIEKVTENRFQRKLAKAHIVPVPDSFNEFIDDEIKAPAVDDDETKVVEGEKTREEKKVGEGFTILGGEDFKKKTKVKRVLPKWLANPTVIAVDLQNLQTKVSSIKLLNKPLRQKLKESGIKYFFPVQAEVIPSLLNSIKIRNCIQPNDICVSAPTGSGKTLAFVLPIIQALEKRVARQIRALVILPTQTLALQVFKTFKKYAVGTSLSVCVITGQNPFQQEQKQLVAQDAAFGYICKVDILVCTAGRLVDHLKGTPGFSLENLEFLVIDEADRVLESVQNDWLYHLEKHTNNDGVVGTGNRILNLKTLQLHRPPQKLLFSATLSQDPEKLEKLGLFQPKLFTSIVEGSQENTTQPITDQFIGKYTTPKELTEKYIVCSMELKPLVLYEFIKLEKLTKTMVFANSLESTHRLTVLLKSLFKDEKKIEEIGSNLDLKLRKNLIDSFEKGDIDILVCTDALARGIDLASVKCVISYASPKYLKSYIHRVGRTARAGENGLAITLVHNSQLSRFQGMLRQGSKFNLEEIKISEEQLEPLGEQYKEALTSLKSAIEIEDMAEVKRMHSAKRNMRRKRKRENST